MKFVTRDSEQCTNRTPIARNRTTGVIHEILGSSSMCGSSRKNSLITLDQAVNADESRFCAKCFVSKPANFYEIIQ